MKALSPPMQRSIELGAALVAGTLVALAPRPGLLVVLLLGVPAMMAVLRWPWSVIYFIVLTSAMTGLVRGAGGNVVAGLSASGLRWIAVGGMLGLLALPRARELRLWNCLVPWAVFSAWCALWWVANGGIPAGLKDVVFIVLPLLIAVVGAAIMAPEALRSRERLDRLLIASLAIPFAIYAVTLPLGLVEYTAGGPKGILGPRPVATHALVILCVALPRWRYKMDGPLIGRITTMLVLGLVVFTMSRLALATAPLVLLIGSMRPTRVAGIVWRGALAGSVALLLLLSLPGVRERMFKRPPESLSDIPQAIDLTGRDELWSVTVSQWLERPWFGWGPGLLRPAIAESKDWPAMEVIPREYPPHNEYLQFLHDEGVVGLIMLLAALGAPLVWHHRRWLAADGRDARLASAHLAAVLGMTVIIVNSAADNTLHYTTVTGPVFLLMASARCMEWSFGEGARRSSLGPGGSPEEIRS